jgi:hypothetical protein
MRGWLSQPLSLAETKSMKHTIEQLIPRFAKLGFELSIVPNSTPEAWILRDNVTGEVDDFRGYGHELSIVRRRLYTTQGHVREQRIMYFFNLGKTTAETASLLGVEWITVAKILKRLRLNSPDPRGSHAASKRGEEFIPGAQRPRKTPRGTRLEAERMLNEGVAMKVIAERLQRSQQRISQIRQDMIKAAKA